MTAQKFRFKHLVPQGTDFADVKATAGQPNDDFPQPNTAAFDGAPVNVQSRDGAATLGEIGDLVRAGKLEARDLVDLGRGWETIGDTLELGPLAAAVGGKRKFPVFLTYFVAWIAIGLALWASGASVGMGGQAWIASLGLLICVYLVLDLRTRQIGPSDNSTSTSFDPDDPNDPQ